jgi:hypothetical protein
MKNKKKNGFIATSLMFSFFIIFLTMSLMIMATYTHYQGLINNLNSGVLKDLNDNVIVKKYTTLVNSALDGDLASIYGSLNPSSSINTAVWSVNEAQNSKPIYDDGNKISYIRIFNTSFSTSGSFTYTVPNEVVRKLKSGNNRKIYVRYNIFRNGTINCSSGVATFKVGTSTSGQLTGSLCGNFANWETKSNIFTVNIGDTDTASLNFNVQNMSPAEVHVDVTTLYIEINKVMIIDVTDAYMTSTTSDNDVKNYLDANVPYFDLEYSIKKV